MAIVSAYVMPHPPIVLPEVGHGEEEKIKDTTKAFETAAQMIAAEQPETIVLSSPHTTVYRDYFHISDGESITGNMGQFRAPQVSFSVGYDRPFIEELSQLAENKSLPAGTMGQDGPLDHGTMIPLYFINQAYTNYQLVRLGISGLSPSDHFLMGQLIKQAAEKLNRKTVFIASADLSHKLKEDGPYGFVPEGPKLDKQITEALDSGDFDSLLHMDNQLVEEAAECGLRSLQILAGIVDGRETDSKLLSYEGTFGVGYAISTVHFKP